MEQITCIAKYFGMPIAIVILVFVIINNAENIMILKGALCQFFAWISPQIDKKALSSKVRGSILKSKSQMDGLEKEILPPDIKVEWVTEQNVSSFLSEDCVIVRIKKKENPQENFILATAAFVNAGLLYNHKRYLDKNVINASKLTMIRKIVQNTGKTALTFFEEEYLPQCITQDEDINEMFARLKALDRNGMFVNILLKELLKASDCLFGEEPDPCLIAESRELVSFLYDIATREQNDDTNLQLKNNYFKIAVILAGKNKVLNKTGTKPYLKQIRKAANEGYETIYLLGIGRKVIATEDIAKQINNDDSVMLYAKQYSYKHVFKDGRKKDAVIYEISSKI